MTVPVQPPMPLGPIFLDEFGDYFSGQNDALKEDLREIDGVPNATYLVQDGRVFVFEKLVQLVRTRRGLSAETPLADLARSLIAEATVSAKEAVTTWGVVPEPYEIDERAASGFRIRHRPFDAHLPEEFENKNELLDVFAGLLLGGVQPGSGEFTYRGQPMKLCEPFDTALLPPRPAIQRVENSENRGYSALHGVTYVTGFAPVYEALFDDVKVRAAAWGGDSAHALRYAQDQVGRLWARAATLRLDMLGDSLHEVPEYDREDLSELRTLYPELSMLSDGSLYAWFDVYQAECCYLNGWTANRDDDFLFYLLGKVAGRQYEADMAKEVGLWAAYALLRGDLLEDALAVGRAAALYGSAISRLARRIGDAMRFMEKDKAATTLRGPEVTTVTDCFRSARKWGLIPLVVEQHAADFCG